MFVTEMAAKHKATTTINDLNNLLLLKIVEYLSLDELCTVKCVSKRFNWIASKMFWIEYRQFIHFDNLMFNMQCILRYIRCFGAYMRNVSVDGSFALALNTAILTSIIKYCRNLKGIKLTCFHFDKPTVAIMKTLVGPLNSIELIYCTIESNLRGVNHNIILKSALQMKELVIIGNGQQIDLKALNKKWAGMERLEIVSVRVSDEEILGHCLRKNPTIKHFSYMPNGPSLNNNLNWTRAFGYYVPHQLEELVLELNNNIDYISLFQSLLNLRRIVINCREYKRSIQPLFDILAKRDKLDVLGLWNVDVFDFYQIPEMGSIRTLELRQLRSLDYPPMLARRLMTRWNELTDLYLDYSTIRNADDIGLFTGLSNLENLFLCDIRSFHLMPSPIQFKSWCANRKDFLEIFVDSRYLTQYDTFESDEKIVFNPFANRISQIVNVISSANWYFN